MSARLLLFTLSLLTGAIAPAAPPFAQVGEHLRGEEQGDCTFSLPDREAFLTLGPGSLAIVAEGGHDVSLQQGSACIQPLRASLYGIQTADIHRRANARIESADGGTIKLTFHANHDVLVTVTGGTALVSLPGWPGTRRSLADGASLLLPAEAVKIPAD